MNHYSFISRLLIAFLLFAANISAQQQSLTLTDAIDSALANNNKIRQYVSRLEQKKYQNLEAWGNFLPKVDFNASYTHLNDPLMIDLSPIRDAMIQLQSSNQVEFANIYSVMQGTGPLSQQQRGALFSSYSGKLNSALPQFRSIMKQQDYKSASFTGIQPIFTGGKLLAAKQFAGNEYDAAETELYQVRDEVKKETINKYMTVMLLRDVLSIKQDVYNAVKRHRDRADKLLKQGLIASYNLLRAEVALADAEKEIDDTKAKYDLAMLDLKICIGLNEQEPLIAADTFAYKQISDSLASALETGMSSNYILRQIDYKKESASQKYKVERSAFLPSVALFGKYELYPEYLSILEPRWTVGITMSMNLFNGLRDYSKLQTSEYLIEEVNQIHNDAKDKIRLLINKNYRDLRNSESSYIKNQKTRDLAAENLRLNEKRFETGLGISLEVIDAYLSFEKTQIDSRKYLFDYYNAYSDLCFNTGSMEKIINVFSRK